MIDIRIPVGLLFLVLGLLLTIFGISTLNDTALYQRALGINVNIWVGGGMLAFGTLMLVLAKTRK
jgi:hypothetical protein